MKKWIKRFMEKRTCSCKKAIFYQDNVRPHTNVVAMGKLNTLCLTSVATSTLFAWFVSFWFSYILTAKSFLQRKKIYVNISFNIIGRESTRIVSWSMKYGDNCTNYIKMPKFVKFSPENVVEIFGLKAECKSVLQISFILNWSKRGIYSVL